MNELGRLLKKLRGYNSLRTIAEKTNGKVSYSYLNILEKGVNPSTGQPSKPNPEVLKILAEVYNYSYDELMKIAGYVEEENNNEYIINYYSSKEIGFVFENPDDKVKSLFEQYKKLSLEEQENFIKMLNIK